VQDREVIKRFGLETWKLANDMKYNYPAKALRVLAFLDCSDDRTYKCVCI
jgi:hypothetical protein